MRRHPWAGLTWRNCHILYDETPKFRESGHGKLIFDCLERSYQRGFAFIIWSDWKTPSGGSQWWCRVQWPLPSSRRQYSFHGKYSWRPWLTTIQSIVGMSTWMMHRSPAIFPDPDRFDPERWLDPSESARLGRYLVSFGKDSRQCIGMP